MKKNNSQAKKWIITSFALMFAAAGAYAYLYWDGSDQEFVLQTETITKGSVNNSITATGTLEATNTVVVGTQVSGVIERLLVDFNSIVTKGQLIAELDKSTLQSSLETAQADLDNAEAELDYQSANFERTKALFDKDMLAQSDYDLANYNYRKSKATVKSANANLDRAARNLSYATIYAPIDGVVLNRAVEEGQTVTASMSTPELFTITNDLKSMQVEADIDEADIGQVEEHQRVEFTVDAFPDLTFEGHIAEIRLQPNESSNVITYIVIISVSNPDLKLKPGMTASITSYIEEANDVIIVPSKATRFTPQREAIESYMASLGEQPAGHHEGETEGERRPGPPPGDRQELDDSHKMVWVKKDNSIRPIIIETGIDDGSHLQVISGLEEGDIVLTSLELTHGSTEKTMGPHSGDQKSPFVQEGKGKRGAGGPPPR